MIADQNFYDIFFTFFIQNPKFFRATHLAMAEGENCAYGLTLQFELLDVVFLNRIQNWSKAIMKLQ